MAYGALYSVHSSTQLVVGFGAVYHLYRYGPVSTPDYTSATGMLYYCTAVHGHPRGG